MTKYEVYFYEIGVYIYTSVSMHVLQYFKFI